MTSGKLSPRQKMINMMYLVLTAMLALNVSKDILKAFHLVEVSMQKTGSTIDAQNALIMENFEKKMQVDADKTKPFYEKAIQARKTSKELFDYIEKIKADLLKETDGRLNDEANAKLPENERELAQPDNIEKHAFYLIKEHEGAEGKKLKAKINSTREALIKLLDKEHRKLVKTDLYTTEPASNGGQQQTWESEMFEHAPLAAVMTMLVKIQNDCKNTESQVLEMLMKEVNIDDVHFDSFVAITKATKGTQIALGEQFEAEIFLGAYDSKKNNQMLVGGQPVEVQNGKGRFTTVARKEGINRHKVLISVQKENGTTETREAEIEYNVYKGMATVSADKMNVVYAGLDNPISVSVPGTTPDQLVVTCAGGTLSGQNGHYNLKVSGGRFVEVIVSVKRDGKTERIETKKYRVKTVPAPNPMLGNISTPTASPTQIRAYPYVVCNLPDFAFDSIRYQVVSFDARYITTGGNGPSPVYDHRGQTLPTSILNALSRSRPGDLIVISNIKANALNTGLGVVSIKPAISITIR